MPFRKYKGYSIHLEPDRDPYRLLAAREDEDIFIQHIH